jgi:hypothetical protein
MTKLCTRIALLAVPALLAAHVSAAVAWPPTKADLTILSFQVSDKVEAEPRMLESIERHLAAIAQRAPEVKEIELRHPFRGQNVILTVDDATAESMSAGKYHAWSSLHSKLRVRRVHVHRQTVTIDYDGIYNTPRLAAEYASLPGIRSAEPNWFIGDGSRIYVQREEPDWHYIFAIGSVDCIAGCARHDLLYFVVNDSGGVSVSDTWSTESSDPTPAWVERWRNLRHTQ